jgi:hypothetical protein
VDGQLVDHHRTRRKLRERDRAVGQTWASVWTLGAADAIIFPFEVCTSASRVLLGQEFLVSYEADGSVDCCTVEHFGDDFLGNLFHVEVPASYLSEATPASKTELPTP